MRAFFSTRKGGYSAGAYAGLNLGFRCGDDPLAVNANWAEALGQEGLDGRTLVLPRMVHGDVLADADAFAASLEEAGVSEEAMVRLEPEGADAVCTRSRKRVLAVTMADCLTALIHDPERATVAAVHAGWRGTRSRILSKTLETLAAAGSIRPESTWVAFGPCLRGNSLEVGPEVAAELEPRFVREAGGRFYFDMPACNRAQALACGIPDSQVRDMGGDTLTDPEACFSFRRDGAASGRMAAVIALV
ncbi:MAG TPA: polyphenol oxidase family protein [Fibrobacteria bacterium]|nr:polyphenol oxidase family protein [Fibrobacteria bacterium]